MLLLPIPAMDGYIASVDHLFLAMCAQAIIEQNHLPAANSRLSSIQGAKERLLPFVASW
jgi:hypothetical protein